MSHSQNGWHCGIKKVSNIATTSQQPKYCESEQLPRLANMASIECLLNMESEVLANGKKKRANVSCREYYCYQIQIRDRHPNEILHSGRLSQQYIVYQYIKLETQRLYFFSLNQNLFRVEVLQGIIDLLLLEPVCPSLEQLGKVWDQKWNFWKLKIMNYVSGAHTNLCQLLIGTSRVWAIYTWPSLAYIYIYTRWPLSFSYHFTLRKYKRKRSKSWKNFKKSFDQAREKLKIFFSYFKNYLLMQTPYIEVPK